MLTCKEVLESLSDYLDADMKEELVSEMKRHIGSCSDCRAEFDSLTMTLKLYRHEHASGPTVMPVGCHDRLVKVLELEKLKGSKGAPPPKMV